MSSIKSASTDKVYMSFNMNEKSAIATSGSGDLNEQRDKSNPFYQMGQWDEDVKLPEFSLEDKLTRDNSIPVTDHEQHITGEALLSVNRLQQTGKLKKRDDTIRSFSNPSIESESSLPFGRDVNNRQGGSNKGDWFTRLYRLRSLQYQRTTDRISQYIRITAEFPNGECIAINSRRDQSIEELSSNLEAEYFYRHGPEKEPLSIALVCDMDGVALRFNEIVGQVLQMDDVVVVLSSIEALSRFSRMQQLVTSVENLPNISKEGASNSFPIIPNRHSHLVSQYEVISNPSKMEIFDAALFNLLSFQPFVEFCITVRCVELILFWLEVEIFRRMESPINRLYARYLAALYMSDQALLKINIRKELITSVLNKISCNPLIKSSLFDEAQLAVYNILISYGFEKFIRTPQYAEYLEAKSVDRPRYNSLRIIGSHADYFEPYFELAKNVDSSWTLLEAFVGKDQEYKNTLQERLLSSVLSHYFPKSTVPIEKYFKISSSVVEKRREKANEVLLTILCGSNDNSRSHDAEEIAPVYDFEQFRQETLSPELREETQYSKKKKLDKLEGFFGNKLPNLVLQDQNIVKDVEDEEENTSPVEALAPDFTNLNELTEKERKSLTRKTRKLQEKFGRVLDDNAFQSIMPNLGYDTGPVLSTISSMDENKLGSKVSLDHGNLVTPDTASEIATLPKDPINEAVEVLNERKKLLKLQQFLGEDKALFRETMSLDKQLTPKQRRGVVRRSNKLERYFGEVPPAEVLATINYEGSLTALRRVVSNEDGFKELVTLASYLEKVGEEPDSEEENPGPRPSSVVKKISKLHNFFGNTINANLLIENNILGPLEHEMQTELEGDELAAGLEKLKIIRHQVDRLEKQIAIPEEGRRDTKDKIDQSKMQAFKGQIGKSLGDLRTIIRKTSIDGIPKAELPPPKISTSPKDSRRKSFVPPK